MKKHVRVVYDRKKVANVTGTRKIELSVYLKEGERKWITVGMAAPDKWEAVADQSSITSKVKHYEEVINSMKMLEVDMTIANFEKYVLRSEQPISGCMHKGNDLRQSFVAFCREHLDKEDLAKNSIKDHNVAFNFVEASGCLNTLADLTKANVIAFDQFLRSQKNKSDYTIHGYHKKIKKYTKILWQLEMIPSDPYQYVKFPKGSNKERNPLTEAELLKLRKVKAKGYLDRARDLFIFMAYTGLAFCDMELFDFATMTEECKDYTYIDGERLKTGSKFFTPILPPAMDVLKKYNYKLHVISNQKINDYCDIIRERLAINKKVTCHIGSHFDFLS